MSAGVIKTLASLNREANSHHELIIMVRDQGTPPKRSLARVVINVLDHNDHAPEFLADAFEGRVFETAAIGTSVVQVLATDKDKGENARIKYSILSGEFLYSEIILIYLLMSHGARLHRLCYREV